ncbi:MAG: hypothetical protein ACJ8F1_02070 [Polyangia bacterium]
MSGRDGSVGGAAGAAGGTAGTGGASQAGSAGVGGTTAGGGRGGVAGNGANGGSGFSNPKSYACNLVLGVSITHDWFVGGFETSVDDAKWEAMAPDATGMAFVETWADPNGATWSFPKLSPCATNSMQPERVIFTGVNWTYTTAAQWVTALEGFVGTVQKKFPSVREIDLMTMLRAPGNMMGPGCTSTEDVVQPFIDTAIQTVVANHPQLVRAAPKFYAPSCDVFTGGGPHLTAAGKSVVAKIYGDSYAAEL